jgi:hypothetical protein
MSHRNTVVMLIDYQVINFIYDINNCSNDNESVHQFYNLQKTEFEYFYTFHHTEWYMSNERMCN